MNAHIFKSKKFKHVQRARGRRNQLDRRAGGSGVLSARKAAVSRGWTPGGGPCPPRVSVNTAAERVRVRRVVCGVCVHMQCVVCACVVCNVCM